VDLVAAAVSWTAAKVSGAWNALMRDGHIAAAARQGADEIGQALKAFPESIGVDEPGAVWNPTQGEIAADRKSDMPSPSEIARNKTPYVPEQTEVDPIPWTARDVKLIGHL
jgi:hypothetical protein